MAQRKAFLLRLPPELHEALEKWAADELRSVNGQIEYLLGNAVREAGRVRRRTATPAAPPAAPAPPAARPAPAADASKGE